MNIEKIFSIGVFGTNENEFFEKLITNKVELFVDIRRRRAVRGAKYSYVNSSKLQAKLKELGIQYMHVLKLAPTNEIRKLQKEDDIIKGVKKTERQYLGEVFINEYQHKVLNTFDFVGFIKKIDERKVKNFLLFCVEKSFEACHRSIVAKRLMQDFSLPIQHL